MSFTHGANDVSNAMGPLAAVYSIWSTGTIASSVSLTGAFFMKGFRVSVFVQATDRGATAKVP